MVRFSVLFQMFDYIVFGVECLIAVRTVVPFIIAGIVNGLDDRLARMLFQLGMIVEFQFACDAIEYRFVRMHSLHMAFVPSLLVEFALTNTALDRFAVRVLSHVNVVMTEPTKSATAQFAFMLAVAFVHLFLMRGQLFRVAIFFAAHFAMVRILALMADHMQIIVVLVQWLLTIFAYDGLFVFVLEHVRIERRQRWQRSLAHRTSVLLLIRVAFQMFVIVNLLREFLTANRTEIFFMDFHMFFDH